jgi:hypothetical protein
MILYLCLILLPLGARANVALEKTSVPYCSTDLWGAPVCIDPISFDTTLCSALETLSKRHNLDVHFFARLIWQESRFNPNARSPANAQGIAQFIPSTAKIRGLVDPWNPAQALDESARYLGQLVTDLGNEGLAAVAYNGGETRAANFIADTAGLPSETWNYVQIITNLNAKVWRDTPPTAKDFRLSANKDFIPACLDLAKDRIYTKYKSQPQFKPWGVQMAAGATKSAARASYNRRSASCKALLRRKQVSYVRKKSAARGGKRMYNARIGFDNRGAANGFCTKLKRAKCSCIVLKN